MNKIALVVATVLAFTLAGCGSAEPSAVLDSDVELIVDLMAGGPSGSGLLIQRDKLQEDLIAECMKVSGFEYYPAVFQGQSIDDVATSDNTDYGWVEGFRELAEQGSSQNVTQVDATIGLTEAAAEAHALALGLDRSAGGCWATSRTKADTALGLDRLMPAVEEASITIRDWQVSSGELAALNERWPVCMRDKGFEVTGRQDLLRMVENRWNELTEAGQDDGAALTLETKIFEADNGCSVEIDEFYRNRLRGAAEDVLSN